MAEGFQPSPEQLLRQGRQHLDSLRSAGVEWLPAAPPTTVSPPPSPAASLFTSDNQPPALDPAAKRRELQVLRELITSCTRCAELASTRTQTVFGVGSPEAEPCFVG